MIKKQTFLIKFNYNYKIYLYEYNNKKFKNLKIYCIFKNVYNILKKYIELFYEIKTFCNN